MITLTITIEEIAQGKLKINSEGIGDATELEIMIAMKVRDSVKEIMEIFGELSEKFSKDYTGPKMSPQRTPGTN